MGKKRDVTTDQEVVRRLENLENRVEAIEEHAVHNTRLKREDHEAFVEGVFGQSRRRAQVFLAANRKRTVNDIAAHLGMQQENVSLQLSKLQTAGLVKVDVVGTESHWLKTQVAQTIGVTELVTKKFKFTKDGLPTVGVK